MTPAEKLHNHYVLINNTPYHIVSSNNKLSSTISLYNDINGKFIRHSRSVLIESEYPEEGNDVNFFDDSSFFPLVISSNKLKLCSSNIGMRDSYLRIINNKVYLNDIGSEFEIYNLPRIGDIIRINGVEHLVINPFNGKQSMFSFKKISANNEYLIFDEDVQDFKDSALTNNDCNCSFSFCLKNSIVMISYDYSRCEEKLNSAIATDLNSRFCQYSNDFNLEIESKVEILNNNIDSKFKKMSCLIDNLKKELYNQDSLIYTQLLHRETFLPYKCCFEGKEVCVVCTGPSAKYYKPMNNVIHIGVNGAIYLKDIVFDFIFTQDYFKFYPGRESLTEDILNYRDDDCIKFVGFHPPREAKSLCYSNHIIDRIPSYMLNRKSIKQYVFEAPVFNLWAHDLEKEPLGNYVGTVFSALQFVLYCHPSKIYLVGCDCSSGDFYTNNTFRVPSEQYSAWSNVFKVIVNRYYPGLIVTSINPVGLKGLFNDVYTDEYLQSNDFKE